MKAAPTNKLVASPAYPKIIGMYNQMLQENGSVNNKKFYETVILPEIPGYHMQSWYQFLKRYKVEAGIVAATIEPGVPAEPPDAAFKKTLLNNNVATAQAIQKALNIGAERLQQIMEHPELMTAKEATDLLFKAMKAQDSRIHAVGKIREDSREQEKFDRAFDEANYTQ